MMNSAEAPVSLNGVRAVARPVACRAPMATLEDAAIAVAYLGALGLPRHAQAVATVRGSSSAGQLRGSGKARWWTTRCCQPCEMLSILTN